MNQMKIKSFYCLIFILITGRILLADSYPDQHFILNGESLFARIESTTGPVYSEDGKCLLLPDDKVSGFVYLKPDSSQFPFNRGLPSWNGTVADNESGFQIHMRFPLGSGWSPWLVVGYWKDFIWNSYGETQYSGGYIDIL